MQYISVKLRNALSTPFTVSDGVRQGGVLSPVLFSIYLDKLLSLALMTPFGVIHTSDTITLLIDYQN